MHKIQHNLIRSYKSLFPKETIKQTALKNQIQQTRVFRIFNGSEMSISEYEKLNLSIQENTNGSLFLFQQLSYMCVTSLKASDINELIMEMQYTLDLRNFREVALC